jgi:hypothetical protein
VLLAAAACLALCLLYLSPLFFTWSNWGIEDWDQHAFYHESARVSLLQYGQLPLWNPYYCGGTDLLANPQSRLLSPTFLLVLLFGTLAGLKLEMLLHAWLGLLGMYCLGRDQGLDRICAWLAPAVYFLSPLYALPTSAGMTWFMSVAYVPWIFLFYLRGLSNLRYSGGAAACLALMYLGGGVYPIVILFTFLGFFTLLGLREHGLWKSSLLLASVLVLTLALGAVKFLPSIAFMREFPRKMTQLSGFSLESLLFGLFHRDQRLEMNRIHFDGTHFEAPDRLWRGISTDYDDVGMYMGPLVAALFLLGLWVAGRRHWKLGVITGVFLWLSLGDRPALSLFGLLHRLPVFESMRYAERFRLIWLLALCLFAGFGLQWARMRIARRFPGRRHDALVASALLACVLAELFFVTRPIYERAFPIPPLAVQPSPEFRQITSLNTYDASGFMKESREDVYSSWSALYPSLLMNVGTVRCYETAFVPRRATPMSDPTYRGEVYLLGAEGSVRTLEWTPNRLRYHVEISKPGELVVNQNFYPAWRTGDGRPLRSRAGLLSMHVTPEDRVLELSYRRDSFFWGAAISAVSWLALLGAIARGARRQRSLASR